MGCLRLVKREKCEHLKPLNRAEIYRSNKNEFIYSFSLIATTNHSNLYYHIPLPETKRTFSSSSSFLKLKFSWKNKILDKF